MPKKVFELANEFKVGAIDLVEQLKAKGFNVRNHMASLTDEEVEQVMNLFKSKNHVSSNDDDAKVKKKVTKKKVTTSSTPVVEPEEVSSAKVAKPTKSTKNDEVLETAVEKTTLVAVDTSESKKMALRKRTVIRRKGSDSDDEIVEEDDLQANEGDLVESELVHEQDQCLPTHVEAVVPEASTPQKNIYSSSGTMTGLRVVSRPPVKAEQVPTSLTTKKISSESNESKPAQKKVDEYAPKMHRFTPVFIPEKKVAVPVEEERSGFMQDQDDLGSNNNLDDFEKEEAAKKRVGDLAALMGGKAKVKVRDLSQMRADEEMKSYQALSSLGRPLFTPVKKKKVYMGPAMQTLKTEVKESKRVIIVHKGCTAQDLASKLAVKFSELVDEAVEINLLIKPSDYLGVGLCSELAALFEYRVEDRGFNEESIIGSAVVDVEKKSGFPTRPPVITIMGHVDHGKTSLLDYIRKAKVASGEAGGITQHIGAYTVPVKDTVLTFLDTPGHAAFSAIRQRGASITDIVVLVVAVDDGVMPQTVESIKFCKQAGVPIIVAVNKIDKQGVNPDRIKQQMMEFELTPEEWGGHTQFVHVSALTGEGVDNLLESIAIQAEMMDLRADQMGQVRGIVIESKIEQGRGPVATILIQEGTLEKGDSLVVGETCGRARSLMDHTGKMIDKATPAMPVQILGLDTPPSPGDVMNVVKNEREAKKIAENRLAERLALSNVAKKSVASLEDFFSNNKESTGQKMLNLIIRTDVHGSYEAIKNSLEVLGNDEVAVKVIGGGVGAITDSDVLLASGSNGFIIGFNMRPVTTARKLAEQHGVDVKTYSIIYELINDVKMALEGLLDPEYVEQFLGRAEVREVFNLPKVGIIAGSAVIDGKFQRGCNIRLLREGKILFDGKMSSLKRFKDDVKEVNQGYECGIGLDNFTDVKSLDIFEAYIMEEKRRKLEPSSSQKL